MIKKLHLTLFMLFSVLSAMAQMDDFDDGFTIRDNSFNPNRALDSLKSDHKKVPKGIRVWTIDEQFGDIMEQAPDTAQHLFINSIFTTGRYGEYNTTGNLGAPRINRIVTDRNISPRFAFTEPYGYFITNPWDLRFTNTLSPITNLYFNSCGDKQNGEDHLKALFATNINKQAGFGFKFDYVYGRGYYKSQSTALFDYTMWGSYIGERYQAHLSFSTDHMKNTENGGITNDDYILHPEAQDDTYDSNEIPVVFERNWNRINGFHVNLSHRYNVGYYKKVPMTELEKEAKRFAIKAEKEKEEQELLLEKQKLSGGSQSRIMATGRPDGALIQGDLSDSTIQEAKRQAQIKAQQSLDSLIANRDTTAVDTSWLKDEYVPVTSFIHTLTFDNHTRTYISYSKEPKTFLNRYAVPIDNARGDSLNDVVENYSLRNRFAIGMHEGLNKYMPMGLKLFVGHELRHYVLPGSGDYLFNTYNEHNVSVGGQIIKTTGNALHYKAMVETNLIGEDIGDIRIDGTGDAHFRIGKDSISVFLNAFYHLTNPTILQRHYHSKFFWWDHDGMNKQMHTHIEGNFSLARTRTSLRVAYDNIQNYVYLAESYERTENGTLTNYTADTRQSAKNLSLITAALQQDFTYGILNWENRITFQKSSDDVILAAPTLNLWTNLYIRFKIAHVLRVDFGAEAFYFSKYNAPEYCPHLGQYAVQENDAVRTKTGNYPFVNVYANCKMKQCRFFAMMSHINAGQGNLAYFTTPHHPMNQRIFRLGLAWTFNN